MTTTITTAEIRALRIAAGEAGDRGMVAVCLRAEGWERGDFAAQDEWAWGLTGPRLGGYSDPERALRMTIGQAREKCARAIADAAAQR